MSWQKNQLINLSLNKYLFQFRYLKIFFIIFSKSRHYHIKQATGKYYLAERCFFNTVPELINYHKHNAAGKFFFYSFISSTRLKQHLKKQHLYGHLPPISQTIQVVTASYCEFHKRDMQLCLKVNKGQGNWTIWIVPEGKCVGIQKYIMTGSLRWSVNKRGVSK